MQRNPLPRRRPWYAILIALVVTAGVLWRSPLLPLPWFAAKYGGDALWALMVFFGFGFLLPRASTRQLAVGSLCFAWAVEFSQLYHAPWIDMIRSTLAGRLVLGATFNWPDLPAYAVGIAVGVLVECLLAKRQRETAM